MSIIIYLSRQVSQHKTMKFIKRNSIFLFSFFITAMILFGVKPAANAQFYSGSHLDFGKNRVQYSDERTWNYYRFKGFDTYFYEGGKALATYTAAFAAKEIEKQKKILDYSLDEKIKFMIFTDLSDLKETNIGLLSNDEYNIGGSTHIIDNKVFIFFNGNHADFEDQIRMGISKVYLNEIIYGPKITTSIKNSILISFPNWFTEGFVSYMAKGWNTEIDSKVRDGFLSGRFKKFKKLTDQEQIIAGHSIWKFIDDRYGSRVMTDVLFMAKVNRSVESAIVYILNIDYNTLIEEWEKYYTTRYFAEKGQDFDVLSNPLFKRSSPKRRITQSAISADGRYLVYAENQYGKVRVKLVDLSTNKKKTIHKYGYKLDEKVDYHYPIFAWSPQGHFLSMIKEKKGDNYIMFYNVGQKKWSKKPLNNFELINSISYNTQGNLLAMSAVQKGQSDIYTYNIGSNTYKRLTYDIYDDEYPVFVNGNSAIIFDSNRPDDTLIMDKETGKNVTRDTLQGMAFHDIFYLDLDKKNQVLKRLTRTPNANETQSKYMAYNAFTWLSDETGVYNRVMGKLDSSISYIDTMVHYSYASKSKLVGNYPYHIKKHDVNAKAQKIVEIITQHNRDYIYIHDLKNYQDYDAQKPIYTSYRLSQKYKEQKSKKLNKVKKEESNKKTQESTEGNKKKKKFQVIYIGEEDKKDAIDFKDYKLNGNQSKLKSKNKKNQGTALFRPLNYDVQFSITQLVTQLDFDYINLSYQPFHNYGSPVYDNQGAAAFLKFGAIDLLEDYRLVGGVKLSPNLRDNEYIINISDLKKRLDKDYTFHKVVFQNISNGHYIKDYIYEVFAKYSWPFDNVKSLRTTFSWRNDHFVEQSFDRQSLLVKNKNTNKAGLKLEYVFDNTRNPAINILYGTRFKLFAEYYQPIENFKHNSLILGADFRKYIKIARNFIWANRLAASTSLGTDRLIYYMGGVDNWMFPSFNSNIQIDTSQNFTYQSLATNLRGFEQNIRNGNNFIVFNTELRLPPFQVFSRKPIKSSFLSNFMLVGFFDVGTAWTGPNPFSDENSLFRQTYYQKPVTVTVINQNDPIVAGYGFGIRSLLFGYYIRLDWAKGIQNGYIEKTKFYLSLSLDF